MRYRRRAASNRVKTDKHLDGKPVWTPLVAIGLLICFVLAMVHDTVAAMKRGTGGWGKPVL